VISQRLLPRADGNGRAVACEVMLVTPTIRDLIIQQRSSEIHDFIAEGREQYGMQTFDQHLADLVTQGVVTFDVALTASTRPADFELQMNMFRQTPVETVDEPVLAGISGKGGGRKK
jgi:twitching motility protein PilT